MGNNIIFLLLCGLTAILEAAPIALLKEYFISKKVVWIIGALACYPLLVLSYLYILNTKSLSVVYSLVKIISILIIFAYSFLYLGETLSMLEKIGIILAMTAILFLGK